MNDLDPSAEPTILIFAYCPSRHGMIRQWSTPEHLDLWIKHFQAQGMLVSFCAAPPSTREKLS